MSFGWKVNEGEDKKIVNIVSVYAPCDARMIQTLWEELLTMVDENKDENFFLMYGINQKGGELVKS